MTKTEEALVRIENKVDDAITSLDNHLSKHQRIETWLLGIAAALIISLALQAIAALR